MAVCKHLYSPTPFPPLPPSLPLSLPPSLPPLPPSLSPPLPPLQGEWIIAQPRSSNVSDGTASYSIPSNLLNDDIIITSCIVHGCYNKYGYFTVYLTNNVTVNCTSPAGLYIIFYTVYMSLYTQLIKTQFIIIIMKGLLSLTMKTTELKVLFISNHTYRIQHYHTS